MGRIEVKNLGKAYKSYRGRWSRLAEWMLPFLGPQHQLTWILKDINFTVEPGEAVGIIGINGAGKSTLLKMIVGTTQPTNGSVRTNGRVTALLELGMGFHPDFTGRQNVYMAGQLMGLNVEEISELMPQIEAFAEIGDYIDQQVRVYSSGMQVRLAFSVATARRPDVLIVDEALSVGDTYFQQKSFSRIREIRKMGTTLLIVSHDKGAIQSICDRAILLNAGALILEGEPEEVMDYYNAMLADLQNHTVRQEKISNGKTQTVSGSGEAKVVDIALYNEKGDIVEVVHVGQLLRLKIDVKTENYIPELVLGYMIKDRFGQPVFGTNTYHLKKTLSDVTAGTLITYNVNFSANLGPGVYSISTAIHTADTHINNNYEWRDLVTTFSVINVDKENFVGTAWIPPVVEVQQ